MRGIGVLLKAVIFIALMTCPLMSNNLDCFQCQCSNYSLDKLVSCKGPNEIMESYFHLWTTHVNVVVGSDVILAAEVKAHTDDYCWCTNAQLEWNGLFQNSSGRLLTVHIEGATKEEMGKYYAVLYLNKKFYFSSPIFLNVTGPEEVVPGPNLDADPKMGAIVVGSLFVAIIGFGIVIFCWKMKKKRRRDKRLEKQHHDMEAESRLPLAWELQHPSQIIAESSEGATYFGPDPEHQSDISDEEGSASTISHHTESLSSVELTTGDQEESDPDKITRSEKTKSEKQRSDKSIKSERQRSEGGRSDVERAKSDGEISVKRSPAVKAVQPICRQPESRNSPYLQQPESRNSPYLQQQNYAFVPITDDRFTTERSWYKSLNTEVVSESLLSNKERELRKEEKRRRKSIARASSSIAQGLLKAGAVTTGGVTNTKLTKNRIEQINEAYRSLTQDFKYGRSLPTPQPAGARPTVMTVFPSATRYHRPGITIHTTNPVARRHVATLFQEDNLGRNRSVTFSQTNLTKRFKSADVLAAASRVNGDTPATPTGPRKSNLKSQSGTEIGRISSSESTSGKEEKKGKMRRNSDPHLRSSSVPELDLTPPSPIQYCSPPSSRFTVKKVENSELDIVDASGPQDPLMLPCWDFTQSSEDPLVDEENQVRMHLLSVPGRSFVNESLDGYWTS